ncbi:two-component sensor histidine kinase [Spirochaetia bacterium]|nr:two-component sensor histidine kinase [Spirochaetia bacterium]
MTIKKRLFYSNLLMAIAPLAAFLILFGVADEIREDIFFKDTDDEEIRTADELLFEIQNLIENSDPVLLIENSDAQRELLEKTAAKGYHLEAAQGGRVLFSNLTGKEKSRIAKYAGPVVLSPAQSDPRTLWVYKGERKYLRHSVETISPPLVFIAAGAKEKEPDEEMGAGSIAVIITGGVLLIAAAIFIVILVSLFLANRMVKNIVLPLDNLSEGAQRIQEGNLDEDIPPGGVEELEKVCGAFNEMQRRLKANIQKNLIYEANRKEMLAGISHDLRTPLTSIKNYVKGLQDDIAKTPEKQREYLDVVYRKSCVMEVLINQLFLFSKLETGNLPFQFKPVPIQKYIVTVLDSLEYDLKKNNAALTLNSSCTGEQVLLDTEQMTRVITNILDNSVKYNPGRHINITVTVFPERETGKLVSEYRMTEPACRKSSFPICLKAFTGGMSHEITMPREAGWGLRLPKTL